MSSRKSEQAPEPVPRQPLRRRGHHRVAALLDAAASVFARDGYDAATMTAIAAEAGASIGSLYQFFPTKPLVADALFRRDMAALAQALDEAGAQTCAAGGSLAAVADQLLVTLIDFAARNPALPVVADRRRAGESAGETPPPGMRAQIAAILGRVAPSPAPAEAWRIAGLILLVMKGAVAIRIGDEPDRALLDEVRRMLRHHLAGERAES